VDFYIFVVIKTILIFGAGWLGKSVVKELAASKRKIIVATREPMVEESNPNIEHLKISFHPLTGAVKFKIAPTRKVDEVLVMLPPSRMVNYEHTIASICSQFPSVEHFIFTSSTGVYQEESGWVYENSVLKESHSVVLAERVIQKSYPNSNTIIRLAGLIGNDRHPVLYFLKNKINLNGNNPVNLIHRRDIISALTCALEAPRPGIYNLCYPAHPAKSDYYNEIASKLFQTELEFEHEGTGKMINGSKFATSFKYEYQFDIHDVETLDKVNKDNK
jgi:nucleoside-diphosphate-sugar epimerase